MSTSADRRPLTTLAASVSIIICACGSNPNHRRLGRLGVRSRPGHQPRKNRDRLAQQSRAVLHPIRVLEAPEVLAGPPPGVVIGNAASVMAQPGWSPTPPMVLMAEHSRSETPQGEVCHG
jgi:hypothetical protein